MFNQANVLQSQHYLNQLVILDAKKFPFPPSSQDLLLSLMATTLPHNSKKLNS